MEIRDIEYFAVVAEHGHVGRAAEALGLGQPALSKSLRRLEQAVSARLFSRTSKGVELTPAGGVLLSRVRHLQLALDDVSKEIADINQGQSGHLRIGAPAGFVEYPLGDACRMMLKAVPNVTFFTVVETLDLIYRALLNGELDLAIAPMTASLSDKIVQEHLFDDEFVVVASTRHALVKRRHVKIADLASERWILSTTNALSSQVLFRAFDNSGLSPPQVAMRTPSMFLRDILVSSTNLLGYSSIRVARAAAPRIRFAEFRVQELEWTRRVVVAYRKDAYLAPTAHRFIEILKTRAG